MPNYIKSILAEDVFNRFRFDLEFNSGINIIYGKNGTGKTTLIHILANALEGNFSSFNHLDFSKIFIEFDENFELHIINENNEVIVLKSENDVEEILYSSKNTFPPLKAIPSSARGVIAELKEIENSISITSDNNFTNALIDKKNELTTYLKVRYHIDLDEEFAVEPILKISYFPAFRTMIEAWASIKEKERIERRKFEHIPGPAVFAREWFGPFTPIVRYRSIQMISEEISNQLDLSQRRIWLKERELISEAFLEIIKSLANPSQMDLSVAEIKDKISVLQDQYESLPLGEESKISDIILQQMSDPNEKIQKETTAQNVYKIFYNFLADGFSFQAGQYQEIKNYLDSVNNFFAPYKTLVINKESPRMAYGIGVKFKDSEEVRPLRTLSSGERQILTMIYSATHMSNEKVILIDEPEISLHVDWQRVLLKRMTEHVGPDKQIIACTHSPVISADYREKMIELKGEENYS